MKRAGACRRRLDWAQLLKRSVAAEVLKCLRCGGRREVLALITAPPTVRAILTHLGLPAMAPPRPPARAPPEELELI